MALQNIELTYYFFFGRACERALPAAVLEALLVRPSRRTFEAAEAAFLEVCFVFFGIGITSLCCFFNNTSCCGVYQELYKILILHNSLL